MPDRKGAFYIFPDFSAHYGRTLGGNKVKNSMDMTDYLLNSAGVGVVPGDGFGADNHLRLSFATSLERRLIVDWIGLRRRCNRVMLFPPKFYGLESATGRRGI